MFLRFELHEKNLSIFRIALGLWLSFETLRSLIFFGEIYSANGIVPFESIGSLFEAAHYMGFTHSFLYLSSSDIFLKIFLGVQFILSLAFTFGILFPLVGWLLTAMWLQHFIRHYGLYSYSGILTFYALFWSNFVPLVRHYSIRKSLNFTKLSENFKLELHAPLVIQLSITFLFLALNHFSWSGSTVSDFEKILMFDPFSALNPKTVLDNPSIFAGLNYWVPLFEMFIAVGLLFRATRNASIVAIGIYMFGLVLFFHYFSLAIILGIFSIALVDIWPSGRPRNRLLFPEVYCAILMFLPAFASVESIKLNPKTIPVQLQNLYAKYLVPQRWNFIGKAPEEAELVTLNGQTVDVNDLLKMKEQYRFFELTYGLDKIQFWKLIQRKTPLQHLGKAVRNFFCIYSSYPMAEKNIIEIKKANNASFVHQITFACDP